MPLILYGLKNCDTCKKALKSLEAVGKPTAFVDIRADTDLAAKVPVWLEAAGADLLLNTRSTTWRGLSEAERQGDPATLLIANPTLIKRPVIETSGHVHVGWTPGVQAALLLQG
ncbi:MAG: ArsC family transcriptional regulator [Henriciella sp.]|nr:ArsC family transcriptional regulator [Henriciella sp.]